MKVLVGIVILVLGVFAAFILFQNRGDVPVETPSSLEGGEMKGPPSEDSMMKEVDGNAMEKMDAMEFDYQGALVDVTKGQDVRGINTGGLASGTAKANFSEEKYFMVATFENLPDPVGDDFYEGWVVRPDPFKFISTGELEKKNGVYTNMYTSGDNLTTFTKYVLTIEPNDGDPAPADHILEGDMVNVN